VTDASPRGNRSMRAFRSALPILLLALAAVGTGCRREATPEPEPPVISGSRVDLFAYVEPNSPCQSRTMELLGDLESAAPERVCLTVIDISTPEGGQLLADAGLDTMAIAIDGMITVSWGEGDARRTVSFIHSAGFAWTYDDLRAAVHAAIDGQLRAADPAEAQGVRLLSVKARGQSIRAGGDGGEVGQLVIGERIVLEITAPDNQRSAAQRVSSAADALNRVLEKPFTPNQFRLEEADAAMAVMAGDERLIVATRQDAHTEQVSVEALAGRWRREMQEAVVEAALQRSREPGPAVVPAPAVPLPGETEEEAPGNVEEPVVRPDELLHDPLAPPAPLSR